jgi:arsenite-transporting ATPase
MESLYHNLVGAKELLTDRDVSSIRIVLNPEKMVIKESQRACTFLHLFGYPIDMVIANRIIPDEVKDPYYRKWKGIQKTYLREVRSSFRPLPLELCRLWDQEMVGKELLGKMAQEIYGERDPTTIFYKDRPIEIAGGDGEYVVSLELPFARKEDMDMWVRGDELVLQFRNYKRNILLPRALIGLELTDAHFAGKTLKITFGGEARDGTM